VSQTTVMLVRQEGLGQAGPQDREFSVDMFDRLLHAMESQPDKPQAICFYTDGVKLVCQGSRAVPGLQLIEGMGVRLLICKTCLDYFNLTDKVAAGQISTMSEIVKTLMSADKVITV
jgi:sulfur relay (sulfurtransferase) complex TusBCD TusD component (DsrE family)